MEPRAQDAAWPTDTSGAVYLLFQHCFPPAKVVGKPVWGRFTANLSGTSIGVTLERDAAGNTRTGLGHGPDGTPQVVMLWVTKDRSLKLVNYHDRSVFTLKSSALPRSESWTFMGLDPEWTNVHEKIAGHDARKVLLTAQKENPLRAAGECWVSESLMLVMRERIETPDGRVNEWTLTEVEERAPARDLLALPPDFTER